jgi:hypothetical protein
MAASRLTVTKLAENGEQLAPQTYTLTPAILVAFERQFKIGMGQAFQAETMKIEYIYWLAWEAEQRDNLAHHGIRILFDDWLKTVEEVMDPDADSDPS